MLIRTIQVPASGHRSLLHEELKVVPGTGFQLVKLSPPSRKQKEILPSISFHRL
jgi:hypothetical protein